MFYVGSDNALVERTRRLITYEDHMGNSAAESGLDEELQHSLIFICIIDIRNRYLQERWQDNGQELSGSKNSYNRHRTVRADNAQLNRHLCS